MPAVGGFQRDAEGPRRPSDKLSRAVYDSVGKDDAKQVSCPRHPGPRAALSSLHLC